MRQCDFCSRPIGPTRHTREGYVVGHYKAMTGELERIEQSVEERTYAFFRLRDPHDLVICPQCMEDPEKRGRYLG
ncbi:MAG: hypothetical protein D6812_14650 [Deltaproteobacteria bacterium]|nr:MAG: hypothetical protein D6812_14650 [Deltaproteobacteria bacterium]